MRESASSEPMHNERSVPEGLLRPKACAAVANGLDDRQLDGWERHDPSNVLKHEGRYLLWVTEHPDGTGWHYARIVLLSSADGLEWKFEQIALEPGKTGDWDDQAVLTAYVVPYEGRFYLFYSGVDKSFEHHNQTRRGIGFAVADSPFGPWRRKPDNQVLMPGDKGEWDELNCDDANIIRRNGKWWFYYKGRIIDAEPGQTYIGVATADELTGPYTKHPANPLFKGHALTVTKFQDGVIALPGGSNNRVLWSTDGVRFDEGGDLKHKSTGVFNPDDFNDAADGVEPIEWIIDVLAQKPRKLYRIDCQLDT